MTGEPAGADPERVIRLRRAALERAGYAPETAADLAARLDIDLQYAVSLTRHGFPAEVAYEMLRSGQRPVF